MLRQEPALAPGSLPLVPFYGAQQELVNLGVILVVPDDLSSMPQDVQGAIGVCAPSADIVSTGSANRKSIVREREGRVVLGYG